MPTFEHIIKYYNILFSKNNHMSKSSWFFTFYTYDSFFQIIITFDCLIAAKQPIFNKKQPPYRSILCTAAVFLTSSPEAMHLIQFKAWCFYPPSVSR